MGECGCAIQLSNWMALFYAFPDKEVIVLSDKFCTCPIILRHASRRDILLAKENFIARGKTFRKTRVYELFGHNLFILLS